MLMKEQKKEYLLAMNQELFDWLKTKAKEESDRTYARTSIRAIIVRILMEAYNKEQSN
jgi:hypothetical protein